MSLHLEDGEVVVEVEVVAAIVARKVERSGGVFVYLDSPLIDRLWRTIGKMIRASSPIRPDAMAAARYGRLRTHEPARTNQPMTPRRWLLRPSLSWLGGDSLVVTAGSLVTPLSSVGGTTTIWGASEIGLKT